MLGAGYKVEEIRRGGTGMGNPEAGGNQVARP
jgi:hypothetical protein